jgi:hypothetical protein
VLAFFLLARTVEKSAVEESILLFLDKLSDPLWQRLDDFAQLIIGAFFVAIFAVGGVYLTPNL